ncbi:MAG: hypothetical protein IT520_07400 [Burkholderiales bacterium]|nr:hypothetical protein [Burkholderiales bacterium]
MQRHEPGGPLRCYEVAATRGQTLELRNPRFAEVFDACRRAIREAAASL